MNNKSRKIYAAGPSISDLEIKTVIDAVSNGWYENAYDYCELFQEEFSNYHNRKFALMTPNCTTAIHLVLAGMGIGPEDEVIVPECTWIGSTAGVSYLGAKTIFCDIDPVNWCLNPITLEKLITEKTKAIIFVDLFGNMPNIDELEAISKKHNIPLIEDAAEAVGSTYRKKKAGSFGLASVFSFHRTKTITTGEGGMLLMDNEELFNRCSFLRDHGRIPGGKPYWNLEITFKYMPFNVQAALGYAQLKRIDELVEIKRNHLTLYKEFLKDIKGLNFNPEPFEGINGAWITALVFDKKHDITKAKALKYLNERGIPARPFFYPLSSLPAYGEQGDLMRFTNKNAYDISNRGINLPGAMNLKDEDIEYISKIIRQLIQN